MSSPKSSPTELQRFVRALRQVSHVPKRGRNEAQGYDYVQERDVVAAVRSSLLEADLLFVPDIVERVYDEVQGRHGVLQRCRLVLACRLVSAATGQTLLEWRAAGEAIDSGDKATAKAVTSAVKYALAKLCLLATGDDPEADETVDREMESRPTRPPRRSAEKTVSRAANGTDEPTLSHVLLGLSPEQRREAARWIGEHFPSVPLTEIPRDRWREIPYVAQLVRSGEEG